MFAVGSFAFGLVVGFITAWFCPRQQRTTTVVVSDRGGEVMRFGDACMDDLILCVERRRTNDKHIGETP